MSLFTIRLTIGWLRVALQEVTNVGRLRFLVFAALHVLGALAARAQDVSQEVGTTRAVPVQFRGQVLFEIHSPIDTLPPELRAAAIERRVAAISAGPSSVLEAIHVVERSQTSDVIAGDQFVLSVTEGDAAPTGRTRQQLAADYANRLTIALDREFGGRSLRGIASGLVLTLFTTAFLILVIRLINRLLPTVERRIAGLQGSLIRGVKLQRVELVSAAQLTTAAIKAVQMLRWIILLVIASLYLQAVLGFFPWTRGVAQRIFSYGWSALSSMLSRIAEYLPNLFYIAIIFLIVRYVMRGAKLVFDALGRGEMRIAGFHREWSNPTFKIARFLVIAFAAVVVFPYLPGSDSPAFQGVTIFLGVLLSLGSTSAVANVVAGVVLTYMIPFRPGDRVKIADTVGDVVEQNLLVVRVRTIKNVEITIPNAAVLGSHIVNYSRHAQEPGLILHSTVTIGYDVPWRQVHELLVSAAKKTDGIADDPAPFVLQTSLDDFYVSYEINAHTDQPNRMAAIYGELHQNIQDGFAEGGVEIMSPHYIAARDGNTVTIPAEYLSKDAVVPAFRVVQVAPHRREPTAGG
jgi:small-conductance mechanosensitive channel